MSENITKIIQETNTDYEVRSLDSMCINQSSRKEGLGAMLQYAVVGVVFGIVFVKAEIISWFRIQEMFRLQSFHMYGVIGTAVVVGAISVLLIKKLKLKTLQGEEIQFQKRPFHQGLIYGGLLFGLGWAITGACPGPLYAQIGAGATAVVVTLLSAVAGTWVYGLLREKLPH
jgi:uncharacterized protein